jgi:hypothetical protein
VRRQLGWNGLLVGSCLAAYALVAGATKYAGVGLVVAMLGLALLMQGARTPLVRRTRYRVETRGRDDWLVIAGSAISLTACVFARNADPALFAYEPYPSVTMPASSIWLLAALFGLFVPGMVTGSRSDDD